MTGKFKKYFIKTYGCQMNVSDSERIAGWYENQGWKPAQKIEEADEIIINTCSVRESAENRVYGLVNNINKLKNQKSILRLRSGLMVSEVEPSKLKTKSKNLNLFKPRIILTGCMMRYPIADLRKKLPQVDEFKKISDFTHSSKFIIHSSNVHVWVPIMEGCNNFCSYCVVPFARGREKSKPFEEIVCEVKELAKRGYKEITLLGQNVNSYGGDAKMQRSRDAKKFKAPFALLLRELNKIDGLEKISFITSNPWDLDDEIIEAMKLPKIDRYLHLAVQSGDDEILKKMNRKYTAKQYLDLVKKIREKIPDIRIGTDIIVGFSGETEKQFQNTVKLCKKIGFEKAYISMYSPRSGTVAYKLKDDVPHKEKRRRWRILEELINKNLSKSFIYPDTKIVDYQDDNEGDKKMG